MTDADGRDAGRALPSSRVDRQLVQKIGRGYVIDHLPSGKARAVLQLLGLDRDGERRETYIGVNVSSRKLGRKDFIKVVGDPLKKEELDRIALIAPQATVSRIDRFQVAEKVQVSVPPEIVNAVRCANPNCISHHEPGIPPRLRKIADEPVLVRCHYCGRKFSEEEFRFV